MGENASNLKMCCRHYAAEYSFNLAAEFPALLPFFITKGKEYEKNMGRINKPPMEISS